MFLQENKSIKRCYVSIGATCIRKGWYIGSRDRTSGETKMTIDKKSQNEPGGRKPL